MIRTVFQRLRRVLGTASAAPPAARLCERCNRPQVFHLTTVSRAGELSEAHLCEACARPVLTVPYPPDVRPTERPAEVRVEIEQVVICETDDHQLLIFREADGDRRLPLVLGIFEATVIDRLLKGMVSPRPLTHDAWFATVAALGAEVTGACIHDREDDTFFAELRLNRDGELARVDMRPSDAFAVTLKAGAPFLVAGRLLGEPSRPEAESA